MHQQAAEVLYRLWWEEAKTSTEEEKLEIHRLALLGKQGEIAAEIGSRLANNWKNKSRFREALQLCKSTLEIKEDYRVLKQIGYCEQQLGDVDQALKYYQQALNLCPSEDKPEKASIYHYLGYIYADTGKIEEAIALYHQSLEIKESIGDIQGKAATLHELGYIYADTGKIDDAIALYQQSLQIEESIGNVQGQAATLHCLANIYTNTGKIEEAIALYHQSLEIHESVGDVQGKAANLHNLGYIYAKTGKIEEAIALYQQSLEIHESIGDVQTKAATLAALGRLLAYQKGDFVTALDYLQQSLEIFERIQSPNAERVRGFINDVQQMANS